MVLKLELKADLPLVGRNEIPSYLLYIIYQLLAFNYQLLATNYY